MNNQFVALTLGSSAKGFAWLYLLFNFALIEKYFMASCLELPRNSGYMHTTIVLPVWHTYVCMYACECVAVDSDNNSHNSSAIRCVSNFEFCFDLPTRCASPSLTVLIASRSNRWLTTTTTTSNNTTEHVVSWSVSVSAVWVCFYGHFFVYTFLSGFCLRRTRNSADLDRIGAMQLREECAWRTYANRSSREREREWEWTSACSRFEL